MMDQSFKIQASMIFLIFLITMTEYISLVRQFQYITVDFQILYNTSYERSKIQKSGKHGILYILNDLD